MTRLSDIELAAANHGKASIRHQCDRCGRTADAPVGHTLPAGWISHPYLGTTLCPDCQEAER